MKVHAEVHGPAATSPGDVWKEFGEDEREAVLSLVRQALLGALENLDWVPKSFMAISKTSLDVAISIEMADIQAEVLRSYLESERRVNRTKADLLQLLDNLRG